MTDLLERLPDNHCTIYLLVFDNFTFTGLRILVDYISAVTETHVVVAFVNNTAVGFDALCWINTSFSYCLNVE